jgi:hypothetical protein
MLDPFHDNEDSYWISFTDLMTGILAIFLLVAGLLIFHLTEPKKTKESDIQSPGIVSIQIFWIPPVDIDLWVKSPDDRPVGYSRKQGKYFDLLRDDMGFENELVSGRHYENAFARKAIKGEYIVNLHMYDDSNAKTIQNLYPIEIDVEVQIIHNEPNKNNVKRVLKGKFYLTHRGEEITVVRFMLDENSELIVDSVNREQIPLRSQTYTPSVPQSPGTNSETGN